MAKSNSGNLLATIAGAGLAVTGIAHFFVPTVFRGITETAFPDDPEQALKVNGTIEAAVGAAIAVPKTRKVGLIGLGAYIAYLAANTAKARRR
ncbi:hypothetical protein [Gordonia sp. (in: high G+C Gram-positive bacteria)]|uniref:hypothetical protein n=1 Tax=Gordonia sp. (in: high G+C Gram-positive bacteria) TaxID=84139 RepID=UPI003C7314CB